MKPRLYDENASAAMQVRITPTQRKVLERVAQINRTSITGVIRDAVDSYCGDCGADPVFRSASGDDDATIGP